MQSFYICFYNDSDIKDILMIKTHPIRHYMHAYLMIYLKHDSWDDCLWIVWL